MTEESQIVRDKFAAYSNITNKERPFFRTNNGQQTYSRFIHFIKIRLSLCSAYY